MAKKHLSEILAAAQTEEELKFAFVKYFSLPFSTRKNIDLYTPQILFELKLDKNLRDNQILARIVAQSLYYVRKFHFGQDERPFPPIICIVTKNFAAVFPTEIFADFYSDETRYDWDLAPSKPCKILVADLANFQAVKSARVFDFADVQQEIAFATLINNTRKKKSYAAPLKRPVTENNFYQIFLYWQSLFAKAVKNSHKPSEYFLIDIEADKSEALKGSVLFRMNDGERIEKPINVDDYNYFWSRYEKISDPRTIIAIRQRMDCLTEINLRRYTGEFYTPLRFADKAWEYLRRTVRFDKNIRVWDMAAGTGNLEFNFPQEILPQCYISTLIDDEADYCKKLFPAATVFQFDFLNDAADKLPAKLRADLDDPNITWLIYINPPYATANNYERDKSNVNKDKLSMTAVRKQMLAENLGQSSQELTAQFLYRISRDFAGKRAYLSMFSKIKYINANADQKFRDKVFRYKFERGFVFDARNFDGCKGAFPVGFLIWNLAEQMPLEEQTILLDVYDSSVEKVAKKIYKPARREEFLNLWIERPPCTKKFPPMKSALNFGFENKNRDDLIAENALASMMCKGNDFLNQNGVAILSAPYASGHDISITAKNFESAMVMHVVRRLPKATWLNDRDQFMRPTKDLPREFIVDCVVWSLFAPSNQTVSLRDVEYEGEIYQITNNFYPFLLSEVRGWEISSPSIRWELFRAQDRFAALWLSEQKISPAAAQVIESGRELYRRFYKELPGLDVRRWKIETWDAGWYQIRMALEARIDLTTLSEKLLPQIYELGFLRDEVKYF